MRTSSNGAGRSQCEIPLFQLERAISTLRDAVDLTPHGHPQKPARLNNLGNSFVIRFKPLGELSNLEQAIALYLLLPSPSALLVCDFMHRRNGYHVLGVYAITLSSMHILFLLPSFLNSLGLASPLHIVTLSLREVLTWCERLLLLWTQDSRKLLWSGSSKDARSFGGSCSSFAALMNSRRLLIQIMPIDFGNSLLH